MRLSELGWNDFFQNQFSIEPFKDVIPARISEENKGIYRILTEKGELLAEISGSIRYHAFGRTSFPAVGDWVAASPRFSERRATIRSILQRETLLMRKKAGEDAGEQIIAANLNVVFIVTSLNQELNYRRIERYLAMIWDSGASPVILLTKSDLVADPAAYLAELELNMPVVPVHTISAIRGIGLDAIEQYLGEGRTAAFVGSSGVGKSTIINALAGNANQHVQPVRASDDRGRHTTSSRQLFLLSRGGIVIDTPGMRELQLWNAGEGLAKTFEDIEIFAQNCKYRNCSHINEPDCGVLSAIELELLPSERLASYRKLQAEQKFLESKIDIQSFQARKRYARQASKSLKILYKNRRKHQ